MIHASRPSYHNPAGSKTKRAALPPRVSEHPGHEDLDPDPDQDDPAEDRRLPGKLRPDLPANDSLFLTTSAAVAVARGIESVKECKAGIKWVNDIFIDGLKVCGILTEGAFNMENGGLDYAIVGIGINVLPPEGGFPEELKNIAGAIFTRDEDTTNVRSVLVANVLNYFMEYYILKINAFPVENMNIIQILIISI